MWSSDVTSSRESKSSAEVTEPQKPRSPLGSFCCSCRGGTRASCQAHVNSGMGSGACGTFRAHPKQYPATHDGSQRPERLLCHPVKYPRKSSSGNTNVTRQLAVQFVFDALFDPTFLATHGSRVCAFVLGSVERAPGKTTELPSGSQIQRALNSSQKATVWTEMAVVQSRAPPETTKQRDPRSSYRRPSLDFCMHTVCACATALLAGRSCRFLLYYPPIENWEWREKVTVDPCS